ncbi:hypothetical protein Chor_011691 [Crotalus horridus]
MKYFYSSISEPSQEQPHFVGVGYVDGQVFVHYDSNSRRMQPRVSWMEKAEKEDPQYRDMNTRNFLEAEDSFKNGLETLRTRYNQSEVPPSRVPSGRRVSVHLEDSPNHHPVPISGLHTWQRVYGCELQGEESKGGFDQFGYDGRTFLTFDKETLTWVAPVPQAQISQRKWDAVPGLNQGQKSYLEEICIEWLERYLSYGKETLLRTEPPEVTMSSKMEVKDGMETHVCRLHGFYPREIEASWMRDGEVWLQDTLRGSVAPNADGTFHTTLSIRIDPKERGRYRCHVEHDSLPEPLDVALKEPKSSLGIIIGCVVAGLVLLGVIVGIWFFSKSPFLGDGRKMGSPLGEPLRSQASCWDSSLDLAESEPVAPGRLPSNNDDTGAPFFYWLSLTNHPLLLWVVALLITRSASFSACDFWRADRSWRIAARMALRSLPLLVLGAVALWENCLGNSSHSMKYFYTSISEPSQGLPHFVSVGYVDGQAFIYYDSNSRRREPRVSWMEKVGKEDPQYWDRNTQRARSHEETFRGHLETLRLRYNQSEGLHTWQWMVGCELQADGSKGGFMQYGYEGRTFITFDKERLTWVAPQPQAQISQRKWDALPGLNERQKAYLEEECIEWLEKHLSYGKETLLRTEPPEVTMSSKTEMEDGMETHICRLHGFYPREIEASWTRDGEVWLQDTLRGSVAPNADGTFHTTLSIRIDPKERGRYRCHVEHDSLPKPLDVALKEPKSSLGIIIGCVVAALVLLGVIVGIWFFSKSPFLERRQDDYRAAPRNEEGSSRSGQGNNQVL